MSRVDMERDATESPPEAASANGHHDPPHKAKAKKVKANVLSVDQLQTLSTSQVSAAIQRKKNICCMQIKSNIHFSSFGQKSRSVGQPLTGQLNMKSPTKLK